VVTWGIDETESRFVDVYNHSKMLIVDDVFMSVGSANKNNRGMIYEAEMNVAVVDFDWVSGERRRILSNLLPGISVSDDPDVWWQQLRQARDWNDSVYARWEDDGFDISLDGAPLPADHRPVGFVYSLVTRGADSCLLEGIGPDVM
jgi:phosphatidylserine/phosphatidylglycerophosphate/cardiolipin synthase-like enzyme